MSKRKRQKSLQNFGIPKERLGRIAKYSNPIQRTQDQRSRAVALRNARMRLLNPYDPVNIKKKRHQRFISKNLYKSQNL